MAQVSDQAADDAAILRNLAMEAWIRTFPMQERLDAFLASIDEAQRALIQKDLERVRRDAENFIHQWKAPIGMEGLKAFTSVMCEHLSARHPWANEESLSRIRSYASWYIWHEGY